MSASRKRKSPWLKRLSYLALLLTGGGVGGWQLSDHPVLLRLLGVARQEAAQGGLDTAGLGDGVIAAIDRLDSYHQGGRFEVTLNRVTLDPGDFRPGQTLDIQARVLELDDEGKTTVAWDSRRYGSRLAVVGQDDLAAGWPDRPFILSWNPGDRYVLEVWNCKGFRATRLFTLDRTGDPDEFPLRPGAITLGLHADGRPVRDPGANTLTLAVRPAGDERPRTDPDRSHPDDSTELAEKPLIIR